MATAGLICPDGHADGSRAGYFRLSPRTPVVPPLLARSRPGWYRIRVSVKFILTVSFHPVELICYIVKMILRSLQKLAFQLKTFFLSSL